MFDFPDLDAATLGELLRLRALGASYVTLATMLNRRAIKGEHGGRWYGATVRKRLLRVTAADPPGHARTSAGQAVHAALQRPAVVPAPRWPGTCKTSADASPTRLPEPPASSLASPLP